MECRIGEPASLGGCGSRVHLLGETEMAEAVGILSPAHRQVSFASPDQRHDRRACGPGN